MKTLLSISSEVGIEMEHEGLIVYPHDRENCSGCAANRALREMTAEAIREMLEKVDKSFTEKKGGDDEATS